MVSLAEDLKLALDRVNFAQGWAWSRPLARGPAPLYLG